MARASIDVAKTREGTRRGPYALALALGLASCARTAERVPPAGGPEAETPLVREAAASRDVSAAPFATPAPGPTPEDAGAAGAGERASDGEVSTTTAAPPEGMLIVPAGAFLMGADKGGEEDEHPAHDVTLKAFYLDRTEVTNAAYARCVAEKKCRQKDVTIASHAHAGPDQNFFGPEQPVVGVSWDDARAYCTFVEKRLPREAEWEKAARGTDGRRYPWGDEKPTPEHAVFARAFGRDATDPVATHPKGAGPYGHDDLAGNVWEWIEDAYDPIAYRRAGAPRGEPGTCAEILATLAKLRAEGGQGFTGSNPIPNECEHVLRGGAFNYPPEGLRTMNRVHHPGRFRLVMSGFRCAKDAE